MIREPVNVEGLQRAIVIWETLMHGYKGNMDAIKKRHKLTWWARPSYWQNEKGFHKGFTALIKRRIELQTAIKEKEN